MRQQKIVRECPECFAPLKRVIGATSRRKYWQCTKCSYRKPVNVQSLDISDRWYPR